MQSDISLISKQKASKIKLSDKQTSLLSNDESIHLCFRYYTFQSYYYFIDLIQHKKFQEKRNSFHGRFTQNWWTFEERVVLAARVFKVRKSRRNKVILPVKLISYYLRFSRLFVVYFQSSNFDNNLFKAFQFQSAHKKTT